MTTALLSLLADPEDVVASEAAIALGRIGDAAAVPALVEGLDSGRPELEAAILIAFAHLGAANARAPLIGFLSRSKDPDMLALALAVLMRESSEDERRAVRKAHCLVPVPDELLREADERIADELGKGSPQPIRSSGSP
jgi:HEAT repeat protein